MRRTLCIWACAIAFSAMDKVDLSALCKKGAKVQNIPLAKNTFFFSICPGIKENKTFTSIHGKVLRCYTMLWHTQGIIHMCFNLKVYTIYINRLLFTRCFIYLESFSNVELYSPIYTPMICFQITICNQSITKHWTICTLLLCFNLRLHTIYTFTQ